MIRPMYSRITQHSLSTIIIQKRTFKVLRYVVQRKVDRFLKNDYGFTTSFTAMLQDLGWPTLKKDGY